MDDHTSQRTDEADAETAEAAFRRIARRKLNERRFPEDQIESKLAELLRKGASVRIDVEEILGPKMRS